MLPQLAKGDANKVWIIPSELNDALKGLGSTAGETLGRFVEKADPTRFLAPPKVDVFAEIADAKRVEEAASQRSVNQAIAEAQRLEDARKARLSSPSADLSTPELEASPQLGDAQ
jgi:hypothetical protein